MSHTPNPTLPRAKSARALKLLKQLLTHQGVNTQEHIRTALRSHGVDITQPQVSRLLRKAGAIKVINARGESVYSLPHDTTPPSTHSPLAQLVVDVVANEVAIIIHTNPGSAPLIARLLDHNATALHILGTVAGDDTLLVLPVSTQHIQTTLTAIKNYLGDHSAPS